MRFERSPAWAIMARMEATRSPVTAPSAATAIGELLSLSQLAHTTASRALSRFRAISSASVNFNARPNPLDRALEAARRAVDLAPTHALGHSALATIYFFRKEMIPFRIETERALELNPFDASVKAYHGLLIAAAGEWERGCKLVESALRLNPNCPGFFYFPHCWNAYRQGKYEEVLEGVARINMPNYFHVPAIKAAALGQLGRREEAKKTLQEVLALRPDFAATARYEYGKWYDEEHVEQVIDGLRKAGLDIPNQ